jgi:membrane protein YdbS with pleckstrin-like domain
MLALRAAGLLLPPASAGILARIRGIVLIIILVVVLIAVGAGIVELISLPFGGLSAAPAVLLGLFFVIAAIAIATAFGRRRSGRARAGG